MITTHKGAQRSKRGARRSQKADNTAQETKQKTTHFSRHKQDEIRSLAPTTLTYSIVAERY